MNVSKVSAPKRMTTELKKKIYIYTNNDMEREEKTNEENLW